MDLPDITRTIASYLDDDTLQVVFLSGAIPSLISISQDQHFWHERVQTLTGRILPWIRGDWAEAYSILKQELTDEEPNFVNDEDNSIVTTVLLMMGFDPTRNDNNAIWLASKNGNLEIVKVLFSDKRVDPSDDYVLKSAAQGGHLEIVKLLLSDSRVNPSDALVAAVHNNHLEIVKILLLDSRTNPTIALNSSARRGNEEIFRLILEDPRIDLSHLNKTFIEASSGGHEGIMKILLSFPEVDPSAEDNKAIRLSSTSKSNRPEAVRLLLSDPRVDPSARNNASIGAAAKSNNLKIVKLLLEDPRVDPTASDSYALKIAAEHGREDIVMLLLQDYRQDRAGNNEATVRAINSGYSDLAKMMLSSGNVDPDVVLRDILQDKYLNIVKYILTEVTIDPSYLSNMMENAIESRQMEVIQLLLPYSNIKEILSESIREGRFALVRLLFRDQRIDLSTGYDEDFIEAARRGHSLVVLLLLKDGRIDPTTNNNQALREARAGEKNEVVRLLLADSRVQEELMT